MQRDRKLVLFSGAGVSADSGLQTFRDAGGLWENHKVDEIANYLTWRDRSASVHRFYDARRAQLAGASPNAAHQLAARLQQRHGAVIMTQNVDDLYERAGCENVIHLHGLLTQMKCVACGRVWDVGYEAWPEGGRCACNSRRGVKPNVIFFYEPAPEYPKMFKTLASLGPEDVLLVSGTSGQVIQIGELARKSKARTILSNLTSDRGDKHGVVHIDDRHFDHVLHGRAIDTAARLDHLIDWLMKAPLQVPIDTGLAGAPDPAF